MKTSIQQYLTAAVILGAACTVTLVGCGGSGGGSGGGGGISPPAPISRVSIASDGTEANQQSFFAAISGDGRYVTFESVASNLVPNDLNGSDDIFLRDTQTNTTTRVSVGNDGSEANGASYEPAISTDGRYVAFQSPAYNLVANDTNGSDDIFLRDTQTNTTTRVSVGDDEAEGNGGSYEPAISADGRYVAFYSVATNLVANDTNRATDIFVRDTQAGTTIRASLASDQSEADGFSRSPVISADGRYVAFESYAGNLVAGDTNRATDIFVRDTRNNTTTRVSVANDGAESADSSYSPAISADGRYVVFRSVSNVLVANDTNMAIDIFVRDTASNTTTRVSVANDGTEGDSTNWTPDISADGRYVVFLSESGNLVPDDFNGRDDIFVHDRQNGSTVRVSVAADGTEADDSSGTPVISADGRYVAFESTAGNLVADDTYNIGDVFRAPAR